MLIAEQLIEILDLSYLDEISANNFAAQSIAHLKRDGVFNSQNLPKSQFLSLLHDYARSTLVDEQVRKTAGRSSNTTQYFPNREHAEGNTHLRKLLFQHQPEHFDDCSLQIGEIRLYLLTKASQAKQIGVSRELSVENLSAFISKALSGKPNNLSAQILQVFTNLTTTLDLTSRISIWRVKLSGTAEYFSGAKRQSYTEAARYLKNLEDDKFLPFASNAVIETGISVAYPQQVRIFSYWTQESQDKNYSITSFKHNEDRKQASVRVNKAQAKRLSQNLLSVDEHHHYWWPEEIEQSFDKTIEELKSSCALFDQIKALSLEASSLVGLRPNDILALPITFDGQFPSTYWHIHISNDQLYLRRPRLQRPNSVQLPESLEYFCHPLAKEFSIPMKGYCDLVRKLMELLSTHRNACLLNLTNLTAEYKEDINTKKSSDVFINDKLLDDFDTRSFFNPKSIRHQAYRRLKKQIGSEPIAELALSPADQSTSAITSYVRQVINGVNYAGSQISFTKEGIQRYTKTIDDRFHDALHMIGDSETDWVALVNLANERLWMLELACTGRRPVSTGIESFSEMDDSLNYAFLQDKFVEGYEEGRIVYIPNLLKSEYGYFKKLLGLLSTSIGLPKDLTDHYQALNTNQLFQKAPLTSLIELSKKTKPCLTISEVQVNKIFEKYAVEAVTVKNLFRHIWAQTVEDETSNRELAAAQLGHSDSLIMLYGEDSNRVRKDDIDQISTIVESRITDFKFETDRFWINLFEKLKTHIHDAKAHDLDTIFPEMFGRAHRRRERLYKCEKAIQKIKTVMVEVDQLNCASEHQNSELLPTVSNEKEHKKTRSDALSKLDQEIGKIGAGKMNDLLEEMNWPLAMSTFRKSQDFPSSEVFRFLRSRGLFEQFAKNREIGADHQLDTLCNILKLIYRYHLLSKTLLTNLLLPGRVRVVKTSFEKGVYLEIATRGQFSDKKQTQCFRISISEDLSAIVSMIQYLKKDHTQATQHLVQLLGADKNCDLQQFLSSVQKQALDIARFEQAAFLATAFGNDIPTTSTNWSSIIGSANSGPAIESDLTERTHTHSTRHSEPKKQPIQERIESLKSQIYVALRTTDQKSSRDKLSILYSRVLNDASLVNYRLIISWARHCVDRHNGKNLQNSTVKTYLSYVFEFMHLLNASHVETMDCDEIEPCIELLRNKIKDTENYGNLIAATNSFIEYLTDEHNEEFEGFYLRDGNNSVKSVKAEWITEKTYQILLSKLYKMASYYTIHQVCFLSCLYRFGLRINEAKFLFCSDIASLGHLLLGLRVRKNKFRNIKRRKPPKFIFVNSKDPLTQIEKDCWEELLASKLTAHGTLQVDDFIFHERIRNSQQLTTLIQDIRTICGNHQLTFHSLRHSFANRRFACVTNVSAMFLKNCGSISHMQSDSNALAIIKDGLRHSRISTSLLSYIHSIDKVIDRLTAGRRRGKSYALENSETSELPVPEAKPDSQKNSRRSRPSITRNERKTYDLFECVHILSEGRTLSLSKEEYALAQQLFGIGQGYHPSAPQVVIDKATRELAIKLGKHRSSLTLCKKYKEKLITTLKDHLKSAFKLDYEFSPFQDLVSAKGEILISQPKDYNWIKGLQLNSKLILFEAPKSPDVITANQHSQILGVDEHHLKSFKIEYNQSNIGNSYGVLSLQKGAARLRMRFKDHQRDADTFMFMVLLLLLVIRRESCYE